MPKRAIYFFPPFQESVRPSASLNITTGLLGPCLVFLLLPAEKTTARSKSAVPKKEGTLPIFYWTPVGISFKAAVLLQQGQGFPHFADEDENQGGFMRLQKGYHFGGKCESDSKF